MLRAPVERVPDDPPAVKPVPVHEVAFVDDHVRVDDCPWSMTVGEAERVAVEVQSVSGGVVAEQELLHPVMPELVWPQELGAETQVLP